MKREKLAVVDAIALPMPQANVDTDQVIPARYLQKPRSAPFGDYLFEDARRRKDGSLDPAFAMNLPAYANARILVAGPNFGCGSSREHAVWALHDHGFRVVVAAAFGDIFRSNAIRNGLLPVVLDHDAVEGLLDRLAAAPGARLVVDLERQVVMVPDGPAHRFDIDPFSRRCLLEGLDELGYTLTLLDRIAAFERTHESG